MDLREGDGEGEGEGEGDGEGEGEGDRGFRPVAIFSLLPVHSSKGQKYCSEMHSMPRRQVSLDCRNPDLDKYQIKYPRRTSQHPTGKHFPITWTSVIPTWKYIKITFQSLDHVSTTADIWSNNNKSY